MMIDFTSTTTAVTITIAIAATANIGGCNAVEWNADFGGGSAVSVSPAPTNSPVPSMSMYPTESMYPTDEETFYYPERRFTEWKLLTNETYKGYAIELGWKKDKLWNLPGSLYDELESLSYFSLSPTQQELANNMLLDEDVWDCYINHYGDYDWFELVEYDLAQYYIGLGWTEDSWYGNSDEPDSEELDWIELTEIQQYNAIQICYFEELWMEYELGKEW